MVEEVTIADERARQSLSTRSLSPATRAGHATRGVAFGATRMHDGVRRVLILASGGSRRSEPVAGHRPKDQIGARRMTSSRVTFIGTAKDASVLFTRAAKNADEVWVATAWATDGTAVAGALWRARAHITALAVGLDFHQTDPRFLRKFRAYARVHQVADGTYHPKVYVFRQGRKFEAIVGSSNFTGGGFGTNLESNVLLRGTTSQALFRDLTGFVLRLADGGRQMLEPDLEAYEREHKRKKKLVTGAKRYQGRRRTASPSDVPLHLPWRAFTQQLFAQERRTGHALFPNQRSMGYIGVAEGLQRIFKRKRRLSAMSLDERKKVAGLVSPFTFFGSMKGAGRFMAYVHDAPARLDRALDKIPKLGPVTWDQLDAFRRALPRPGMSTPAVGTRLLAMKRPDLFICIDSANRANLSKAFGIPQGRLNTYEGYWELLQIIWRCPWFKSPRPKGRDARIWAARVALVDAFYYEP